MKFVSNMLKKVESKSKHDLVRAIIGTVAGFVVERLVENAYDSAFEQKKSDIIVSTQS